MPFMSLVMLLCSSFLHNDSEEMVSGIKDYISFRKYAAGSQICPESSF